MQPLSNFEVAPDKINNNSLTTDNLSAGLFNFIRDDFNASRMQGSSLIQNDVPQAFRGRGDFEIVDNSLGQSLTKQGNSVLKELENGSTPARNRKDTSNRAPDEMPSSGRPVGATGEGHVGRSGSSEQRSSAASNRQNEAIDEMPSSGRPEGATAEEQGKNENPIEIYELPTPVIRPWFPPTGDLRPLRSGSGEQLGTPADNRKNVLKEMPSNSKPAGATAEGPYRSSSSEDLRSSAGDNIKKSAKDEVPSSGKPAGATPESKLRGQDSNHGSSVGDPVQQNRGVEVESRKGNKNGKPETQLNAPYAYGYM